MAQEPRNPGYQQGTNLREEGLGLRIRRRRIISGPLSAESSPFQEDDDRVMALPACDKAQHASFSSRLLAHIGDREKSAQSKSTAASQTISHK
jgi:hypothetical protein